MATPVTLNIPDDMLTWLKQVAADSHQSVENVLIELRYWNPSQLLAEQDIDPALAALADCSDIRLWLVVHLHLSPQQSARLDELIEQGKRNTLSESEPDEMEALLKKVEDYMLLRSEAIVLLKQRGYDVSRFFKQDTL